MALEEVFTEPEPNLVVSSRGFSVRVLGRTGLEYAEGGRTVRIDSEVLATGSPYGMVLYKPSIKFWEDEEPGMVSDQDRDRITDNVQRAFRAHYRSELQVLGPFDWKSLAVRPPRREG